MMTRTLRGLLALTLAALTASLPAQSLTGHVTDPNGLPLANISVRPSNGAPIGLTDANGNFLITGMINRRYDVEFRAATTQWAGALIEVQVNGATNMGTVILQPGAGVTGTVLTPAGLPLNGGNMNVYDLAGLRVFTANDGTNALGQFAITVPIGTFRLRAVPPTGSNFIPFEQPLVVTPAGVTVPTIQLQQGYVLSSSVTGNLGLPVAGAAIVAYDGPTQQELLLLANPTTSAFGQFSILVPGGIIDLEILPSVLAVPRHHARRLYGLVVIANQTLPSISLTPAVNVTGTVVGPAGAVPDCDIDVLTTDGYKLFAVDDNTGLTGLFSLNIPTGTYRFRVDPPVGSDLVGLLTAPTTITATTSLGVLTLARGVPFHGTVTSPAGAVAGADIDLVDLATGNNIVIGADQTAPDGSFKAFVPIGNYQLRVDAPQGSSAAPLVQDFLRIRGLTKGLVKMASKRVIASASAPAILTVVPGTTLPMNLSVLETGVTGSVVDLEFAVRYADGSETASSTLPGLTLVPGVAFTLTATPIPVPATIPSSQLGRVVDMVMKIRASASGVLLDEARVAFVAQ